MERAAPLSKEEMLGLLLAGTAHVALAMVLILHRPEPKPFLPPERITVSLAEDVALDTSAPDPSDNPAAAMAPELAPVPQPPAAVPPPPPAVRPSARPTPAPRPTATRRPTPAPTASRRPSPAPTARSSPRPSPAPTARSTSRATPAPSATRSGGAPQVGADFLDGATNTTGDRGQAGDRASPQQRASINAAIIRQLKPHWSPPSGVDVDRLVTQVRVRLNRDGSLNGPPQVIGTTGQNEANRLQVARHQEQAVRAVRLAAPFDLPEQYYSAWGEFTSNFDNRLAQ